MKFTKLLLLFCIFATYLTSAQNKEITLEDIWTGTFRTEGMDALHSMKNGQQYSVLNFDRTSGTTSIDVYDYKTLKKWLIGGANRCAPPPPQTPLMGGGQSIFVGGMTDWPFWSPWNKICMEGYHLLILFYLFLRSDLTPQPQLLKLLKMAPNGSKYLEHAPNNYKCSN